MPGPVFEVCGPISTGQYSYQENIKIFGGCLKKLQRLGFMPFDILPLQEGFDRLIVEWHKKNGNGYCNPILDIVYKSIFQSGIIKAAFFLPTWEQSFGANWERKTFLELKIPIFEYPVGWYEEVLQNIQF